MATQIIKNAFVSVNGVDLSDHVKSVTMNYDAEMQDNTAMSFSTKSNLPGLKNWDLTVAFFQDFAANKVDATLFPLIGAPAFAFEIRADAGAVSATNPKYTGTGVLQTYNPVAGAVGEAQIASAKIIPGGTSNTLTRATV